MNHSAITKIAAILVGLGLAMWAITATMTDTMSGGIGPAMEFVLVIMIPLFFVRPRLTLYTLVFLLANIEWIKRLAVYFGVASVTTVSEMLVIPIVMMGVLVLSMFAGVMTGAIHMTVRQFGVFVMSGFVMLIVLKIRGMDALGAQTAINAGLYMSMIPVLLILMKDREDFLKFMGFCAWMFLPWAIWGIKQYYTGLNSVELYYVETGLSPVLTSEVRHAIGNPRPFGLAGSQASYGAISFIAWFCLWRTVAVRNKRLLYVFFTLVYLVAVVLSGQRTTLILPILALPCYYLYQSKPGLILSYGFGTILLALGIFYAGDLLNNLDKYQEGISVEDDGWAGKTLRITTYSDRLRGWERLKNPEVWSLFGKRLEKNSAAVAGSVDSADYAHDLINNFLLNVGVVGLLPCLGLIGYTLYRLHALVLRLPKGPDRRMAAGALAYSIPSIVLAIMGGGNFNTTPVNFFTWTFFAMALIVGRDAQGLEAQALRENAMPPVNPPGAGGRRELGHRALGAPTR